MKYMKTNYRGIIDLLELMPEIKETLSLNQLPHFTTINKFFLRIRTSILYNTLIRTVYLFTERADVIAIDSTGYSNNYARLMGSWIGSRSIENQCKEVIGMCIVYNVYRSIRTGLVWIWMFSTRP